MQIQSVTKGKPKQLKEPNRLKKEGLVGLGFVLVLVAGLVLSRPQSVCSQGQYRHIFGHFQLADGLGVGSALRLAGVKVGAVCAMEYDNEKRMARLDIAVKRDLDVADDSALLVVSDGLAGGKYLKLALGGSPINFNDGDEVEFIQNSFMFDEILAKLVERAEARRGKQ